MAVARGVGGGVGGGGLWSLPLRVFDIPLQDKKNRIGGFAQKVSSIIGTDVEKEMGDEL